jgi:hypothetical protein
MSQRKARSRATMAKLLREHPARWWHLALPAVVDGLRMSRSTADQAMGLYRTAVARARRIGAIIDDGAPDNLGIWTPSTHIGQGASRNVFQLGPWHVLKIDDDGDAESNLDEVRRWNHASPDSRAWLCPTFLVGEDDEGWARWSVMPHLDPVPGRYTVSVPVPYARPEWRREYRYRDEMQPAIRAAVPPELCYLGDLNSARNWGMYMGHPVVLDYGGGGEWEFNPYEPECVGEERAAAAMAAWNARMGRI